MWFASHKFYNFRRKRTSWALNYTTHLQKQGEASRNFSIMLRMSYSWKLRRPESQLREQVGSVYHCFVVFTHALNQILSTLPTLRESQAVVELLFTWSGTTYYTLRFHARHCVHDLIGGINFYEFELLPSVAKKFWVHVNAVQCCSYEFKLLWSWGSGVPETQHKQELKLDIQLESSTRRAPANDSSHSFLACHDTVTN